GTTDEDDAADAIEWYFDGDGDGWGDTSTADRACVAPADHVRFDNDCDDADTAYHPGAAESDCSDRNDYNCDGSVGRVDRDGDGFDACEECDDGTDAVFPGAFETCNLVDDDCDGTIDGEEAVGSGTWYADTDGDGYGDPAVVDHSCDLPRGFVVNAEDCDDADLAVSPAGTEVCATAYDDDCDGAADDLDAPDCTDWHLDADLDGYGAETSACACAPFDGYTAPTGDDCDDAEPLANPGGTETAGNGIDDDCDGVADAVALADADLVVSGTFAEGTAGYSVAGGGDVDGDGLDDVLVGMPGDGTVAEEAGAVALVRGGASGTVLTSAADATLQGEAFEDGAGYAVALGDIDGDGFAEALVGAYQNSAGGRDAGGAYLVYGPFTGTIGLADADLFLSGAAAGDAAGRGVALPGDVDGDGIGDLLVGAPSADRAGRSSGSAFLVLGGATGSLSLSLAEAEISGNAGSDTLGTAFSPAGDTDGDGFADVWIGVENADDNGAGSGTVHLLRGPISGAAEVGDLSDAQLLGGAVDDGAGASVANAGDIDGDGHDDVLVGAPDAGDGGAAYLVLGPFDGRAVLTDADTVFTGASGDYAGYAVTGPGDIDGDGARDLVIGGYGSTIGGGANAGAAWLFSGVASGSYLVAEANVTFFGDADDRAGAALAPAGDTDGDGLDELLVGAFAADPGATNGGAAYVLRGW
ncbi:MAG: MopE-related protein, partial [Myxococcota bacterium]